MKRNSDLFLFYKLTLLMFSIMLMCICLTLPYFYKHIPPEQFITVLLTGIPIAGGLMGWTIEGKFWKKDEHESY